MHLKLPRNSVSGFLLAMIFWLSALAVAAPPGSDEEIRERIRSSAQVSMDESAIPVAAAPAGPRTGEAIYNQYCVACHATGVSGSPLFADQAAWAPRIAKGMDLLYANTLAGINVMPARGTCTDCSDEELNATVDYMVDAAR